MSASTVMTVRIDRTLLAALKRKAREEGRSVSKEVVRLIERHVEPRPSSRKRRSSFGMFADYEVVSIDDVRQLRREVSTSVARKHVRRRSRK